MRSFCVAWDVAQSNDSSIVMISEIIGDMVNVQDIIKLPARASYVDQVEMVAELHHRYPGGLIVDRTGCGAGPVDMLKSKGLQPLEVMWTGGEKESRTGMKVNLPKQVGVMATTLLIQSKRLKVTMFCSNKELLKRELQEFSASTSNTGRVSYNGSGKHDDCVSALMLTAYYWGKKASEGVRKYTIMGASRPGERSGLVTGSAGGGATSTAQNRQFW